MIRIHADDTTLTLSAKDPLVLEQRMNCDMNEIQLCMAFFQQTNFECQEN